MRQERQQPYTFPTANTRALQGVQRLLPGVNIADSFYRIGQGSRTGDLLADGYPINPSITALIYAAKIITNPYWQPANPDMAKDLRVVADEDVPMREVRRLRSVFPKIRHLSDMDPRRVKDAKGRTKMIREPFGDDRVLELLQANRVQVFLTHDRRERDLEKDLAPLHRRALTEIIQETDRPVQERLLSVWETPLLVHLPRAGDLKQILSIHRDDIVLAQEARKDPSIHLSAGGVFSRWQLSDLVAQGPKVEKYPLLVDLERRCQVERLTLELKEKLRAHLGVSRLSVDRSRMYDHFIAAASLQFLLDGELSANAGLPSTPVQKKETASVLRMESRGNALSAA